MIQVLGGYWLPLFRAQIGNRFPLVTKLSDSDCLPVTTGYQI